MTGFRVAHPLSRRFRLANLTPAALAKMARSPSYHAPRAADVLDPAGSVPPELPRLSETERRLLDAVLADPDADEPRLAYAAWCDRQGDTARGEMIREQIKTSRRSTQIRHDSDINRECDSGSDRSSSAFIGGSSSVFSAFGAKDLVVRRGFVEGMSLSGRAFVCLGESLMRLTPLREVRLVAVQPYVGELARCPHLARLRRLDLAGNRVGPAGVRELAASAFLGGLRELGLSGNDLGAAGAELRTASWLPGLTTLELADNGLSPADMGAVLAAAPGLVALDLAGNPIGGIRFPEALRALSVSRCGLGPDEVAGGFPPLRELALGFNRLGPRGAESLAGDAALSRLRELDLRFNDIEDAGVEALAGGEHLTGLHALNLAGNRITAAGAELLADSAAFGAVERLDLSANPLGDDGAVAVVRGDGFASLADLNLANCGVTDAGVAGLAATGALGGLESLSLAWNPLGDAGVRALARCPDLANLRSLDLTGCRFGLAGAVALAESPDLVNLASLALDQNDRLPADAVELVRGRFGTMA